MTLNRQVCAATLAVMLGPAPCAHADDDDDEAGEGPAQTVEELFAVGLAFPQEAHEVQLTLALDGATGAAGEAAALELEAEYGITDWLQIAAGLPLAARWPPAPADAAYGLGDVELGALAAHALHPRLLIALAAELTLPTGDDDRGLGEGELTAGASLRAAVALPGFELHALAGIELGDALGAEYGLGLTVPIGPSWAATLEALAEAEDDAHRIEVAPGLVWRGPHALQLGAAARLFAGDGAPDAGLSVLAVVEF